MQLDEEKQTKMTQEQTGQFSYFTVYTQDISSVDEISVPTNGKSHFAVFTGSLHTLN